MCASKFDKRIFHLTSFICFSYDQFTSASQDSESVSRIASKNVRSSETTIGGLPNADWREWASTVKERPMPISYEMVGLWELMTELQAEAYFAALQEIEGIDFSGSSGPTPLLDAMHFGVVRGGTGEPLSSYTYNPNTDFRATLQIDEKFLTLVASDEPPTTYAPPFALITYGPTYKRQINRPTPIFACAISGDVGENAEEENLPFQVTAVDQNFLFGLSNDSNSAGVIAMTNFNETLPKADIASFSFLALDNVQTNYGSILTGVISNDGLVLNDFGVDPGFEVKKITNSVFEVFMTAVPSVAGASSGPSVAASVAPSVTTSNVPSVATSSTTSVTGSTAPSAAETIEPTSVRTILIFPQWYTSGGAFYPDSIAQVSTGVHLDTPDSLNSKSFKVYAGDGSKDSRLGFNFIAISQELADNPHIKHGFINRPLYGTESGPVETAPPPGGVDSLL